MAKPTKKKASAKKPAAHKTKPAHKVSAKKAAPGKAAKHLKSPKGAQRAPDTIKLLGKNNRERKLDHFAFTRGRE